MNTKDLLGFDIRAINEIPKFETHLWSLKICISKRNNSLIDRGDYNARNL